VKACNYYDDAQKHFIFIKYTPKLLALADQVYKHVHCRRMQLTSSANAFFLHRCNFSHYVDHVLTCLWRNKNELIIICNLYDSFGKIDVTMVLHFKNL
jgi:hypothetical protein